MARALGPYVLDTGRISDFLLIPGPSSFMTEAYHSLSLLISGTASGFRWLPWSVLLLFVLIIQACFFTIEHGGNTYTTTVAARTLESAIYLHKRITGFMFDRSFHVIRMLGKEFGN